VPRPPGSNGAIDRRGPSCLRRLPLEARQRARPPFQSIKSVDDVRYCRPMPVDFTQPVWDADRFPGRHVAPVGAQAGARELGASVYELDPGVVGSPLHVHHANEELLVVLAGTLSLRGPDGTQLLSAGAVVAFPRGQAGTHSLVNRSDTPVRYLVVSTTNRPDLVEYPDTGSTLVVLAEHRLAYPHGADADQEPVIAEAMRAASDRDA
jgi:uncharacterized cupin superfamily protein